MSYQAYKDKVAPIRLALFTGKGCAPCVQLKPLLTNACEEAKIELEVFDIADEREAVVALGLRAVPTVVRIDQASDATVVHTGAMSAPRMQELLVQEVLRWY